MGVPTSSSSTWAGHRRVMGASPSPSETFIPPAGPRRVRRGRAPRRNRRGAPSTAGARRPATAWPQQRAHFADAGDQTVGGQADTFHVQPARDHQRRNSDLLQPRRRPRVELVLGLPHLIRPIDGEVERRRCIARTASLTPAGTTSGPRCGPSTHATTLASAAASRSPASIAAAGRSRATRAPRPHRTSSPPHAHVPRRARRGYRWVRARWGPTSGGRRCQRG